MKLVHHSRHPGLTVIDPEMMGTGAPSQENKHGVPAVKRSYWYVEGTKPEDVVTQGAKAVYHTELRPDQSIYDIGADPEGIYEKLKHAASKRAVNPGIVNSEDYLAAVKDAGHHGFRNSAYKGMENVVALFHPQQAHEQLQKNEQAPKSNLDLGHHFIFTVENPLADRRAQEANVHDVAHHLRSKGENAQVIDGYYGVPEKSILVREPKDVDLLHRLVYAHGQESAIESNGAANRMYFYHGPRAGRYMDGDGTQWFADRPEDMYSTVEDGGERYHFRHHFDSDKLHKGSHLPKSSDHQFQDPWDRAKHERGGDREYNRYHDAHRARLRKSEAFVNPQLVHYLESVKQDSFDKAKAGADQGYAKKEFEDTALGSPKVEVSPNTHLSADTDAMDLLRSYKNSPHNVRSLGLKYLVHRVENASKYLNGDANNRDMLDDEFLRTSSNPKNAHVTKDTLRRFASTAGKTVAELLHHKDRVAKFITANFPEHVVHADGRPHVRLTRGLDTKTPGPDHALASYADLDRTGFGSHQHKRLVPLDNVWYSYDLGHNEASSRDFGPENEFLVSPHEVRPIDAGEKVPQLVPRRNHSYMVSPEQKSLVRANNGIPLTEEEARHAYQKIDKNRMRFVDIHSLMNNPGMPEDLVEHQIDNGRDVGLTFSGYDYGNVPVRKLPTRLADKYVRKLLEKAKYNLGEIAEAFRNHGEAISPDAARDTVAKLSEVMKGLSAHDQHFFQHDFDHIKSVLNSKNKLAASEKDLEKGIRSPILFPKLPRVSTRPDSNVDPVTTPRQAEIKARSLINHHANLFQKVFGRPLSEDVKQKQHEAVRAKFLNVASGDPNTTVGAVVQAAGKSGATPPVGGYDPEHDYVRNHEAIHSVLGDVRHRYGQEAYDHVVDHLLSFIHPDDRHALNTMLYHRGYPLENKEEVITHLNDVVSNPGSRETYDNSLASHGAIKMQAINEGKGDLYHKHLARAHHQSMDRMKRSFDKMSREARNIDEQWLQDRMHKAIDKADFKPLRDAHKTTKEGTKDLVGFSREAIDSKKHLKEVPQHDEYAAMLEHPDVVAGVKDLPDGISPKMVHHLPGGTYMAKPYHSMGNTEAELDAIAEHNAPGWATLATRHLYDSARMGHLVEDVRAMKHRGVPITTHKFTPGMHEGWEFDPDKHKVNQFDLARIAMMDFLTNNYDRHGGNIMLHENAGPSGYHPLMAIDHELSFGYKKPVDEASLETRVKGKHKTGYTDSLFSYAKATGINKMINSDKGFDIDPYTNSNIPKGGFFTDETPQLKQWWLENRGNVKKSFLQSLGHVSDRDLRSHLRSNFNSRVSHMDDLVANTPDHASLFNEKKGVEITPVPWEKK